MRSGQSDVEVWQNLFVTFYRRGALLARVLAIAVCLCPCLCPSVCHKSGVPSKRLDELSWVLVYGSSLRLSHAVFLKNIRVSPKIMILRTFGKFCFSIAIVETYYRLLILSTFLDKVDALSMIN